MTTKSLSFFATTRLMENGDIESKFTFTVVEALVRRP